ncbi:hypothetical protein EDD18DRAFT_1366259 [Armillaria luteobubalina]|uniref:Uncharacterized protein n=1 Tax=Armillaria luteobubalina TaxID=153913 RepID=A0AA39P2W4_9AGAR|nr:hypothetical protein EDD18DRAFT_1366259 [Armillaria luteobubalina]
MTYNDKKNIGSKKANKYATTTVVNEYFQHFFWVLPLNQDPESDDPPFVDDAYLSEEQLAVKAIPKWLDYHASKSVVPLGFTLKQVMCDPMASFLSRLSGVEGPRQCAPTTKQLFGKDNDDINRHFEALWISLGGEAKDRPAAWASFVAEEFDKLPEESQRMWTLQAAKATEEIKKSRGSAYAEPTLLPPEEAQRVIDSLVTYFGPLLEGMSKMIGCHISMAVVGPELRRGGQVNVIILHEGVDKSPKPVTFDEGGGEKYRIWLAALGEWGMSCYSPEDQKVHSLPGIGVPLGPPQFLIPDPPWRSAIPAANTAHSEQPEQGAASGVDESEEEARPIKKKVRDKGKKHARVSSAIEREPSEQRSKRSKSGNDDMEMRTSVEPQLQPNTRSKPQPKPRTRTNILPALHQLLLDDTNRIDPALLTGGVAPGTFIPNCGPNDHPNPFRAGDTPQPPLIPSDAVPIQPELSSKVRPAYLEWENWPEWFAAAQAYLGKFKLGDDWDRLVNALSIVEGQRGFIKTGKPLQWTDRPPQISLWIQNARLRDPTPLGDRDAFTQVGEGEGPIPVDSRRNSGEWDRMDRPGQNGLYSVVASLAWWGESISHNAGAWKEWCVAVDDVLWALECLAMIAADA